MSAHSPDRPIAKASVRRRLWNELGLGPYDGTSFREPGDKRDRIVLCLKPSIARDYQHVREFEGFDVEVRLVGSFKVT